MKLKTERTLMWLQGIVLKVWLELVSVTNWYLLIRVEILNNLTDKTVSLESSAKWPRLLGKFGQIVENSNKLREIIFTTKQNFHKNQWKPTKYFQLYFICSKFKVFLN